MAGSDSALHTIKLTGNIAHWPFDSAATATKVTPLKNYNNGAVRKHFVCLFCMCECDHCMFISDWSLLTVFLCLVCLHYSLAVFVLASDGLGLSI